jgi:hypothetical protein
VRKASDARAVPGTGGLAPRAERSEDPSAKAPDPVMAAWDDAVAHWDDPAKHQALLGVVAQHSCFAWAAGKYKERAGDPIADKQLERLRTSAMATMLATSSAKKKDEPTPFRATLLLFIALLVAMVIGMVVVKSIHDRGAPPHAGAH